MSCLPSGRLGKLTKNKRHSNIGQDADAVGKGRTGNSVRSAHSGPFHRFLRTAPALSGRRQPLPGANCQLTR